MNAVFSLRQADYPVNWRFDFIVAISSLRAVGHVLHKIDCKSFPIIRPEVEQRFQRWKRGNGDDAIFTQFIEESRSALLKAYEFPGLDETIFSEDEFGGFGDTQFDPDIVMRGPLKGENVISLFHFAHDWWETELNEIAQMIPAQNLEG